MKLMRKLFGELGFSPVQIITDKLKSYHKAFRILGLAAEHIDIKERIIEPRIHIFLSVEENEKFSGLHHQVPLKDFSTFTQPFTIFSIFNVT